jgi:hypothetical protein
MSVRVIRVVPARLFRRHIGHGSERAPRTCQLRIGDHRRHVRAACGSAARTRRTYFRQTEVEDFGLATLGHEDIERLEIPMDDVRRMRRVERVGERLDRREGPVRAARP